MHTLGHVFIWLIAVGALAASVLTAKTFDVRNSWAKKVETLREDIDTKATTLALKETELRQLRAEFHHTMLGWDQVWGPVTGNLALQGTNAQLESTNLGRLDGLAASDPALQSDPNAPLAPPTVYVFQPQQDGTSLYVGAFQVDPARLGDHNAMLLSTWTVRPTDFDGVNPNGPFRFRTMIPSHFTSEFANVRGELTLTERQLADKQQSLIDQTAQDQLAQDILDERTAQLTGAPNAAADPNASPESAGLVALLEAAEEARNNELAEEDYLRRQVKQAEDELTDLTKQNRDLAKRLEDPKPTPEVTAKITSR